MVLREGRLYEAEMQMELVQDDVQLQVLVLAVLYLWILLPEQ